MSAPHVLISGAGIAGIATALQLVRSGISTTVVERAPGPRPGGQAVDLRGASREAAERMGLMPGIGARRLHEGDGLRRRTRALVRTHAGRALRRARRGRRRRDRPRRSEPGAPGRARRGRRSVSGAPLAALRRPDRGARAGRCRCRGAFRVGRAGALRCGARRRRGALGDAAAGLRAGGGLRHAARRLRGVLHDAHSGRHRGRLVLDADRAGRDARDPPRPGSGDVEGDAHAARRSRCGAARRSRRAGGPDPPAHRGRRVAGARRARGDGGAEDFYFDELARVDVPDVANGRVALVGDAGYCGTPLSGMGTAMALVGAYVLAGELADACAEDVPAALARYARRIEPFIADGKRSRSAVSSARSRRRARERCWAGSRPA